jgi:hypothetical protein
MVSCGRITARDVHFTTRMNIELWKNGTADERTEMLGRLKIKTKIKDYDHGKEGEGESRGME